MWDLMAMSLVSGLSTPLGAWVVLRLRGLGPRALGFILALASGVMVTVAVTELVPNALAVGGKIWATGGIGAGILLMAGLGRIIRRVQANAGRGAAVAATGWAIAVAIALHDVPEGMAIGAGGAVRVHLGLILAVALALHNLPEGMSIAAPLALGGVRRTVILAVTTAIAFVTPLGTVLALAIGSLRPELLAGVLALAAGAMAYVVAHDTFPEAAASGVGPTAAGILAGVGLMAALLLVPHGAAMS